MEKSTTKLHKNDGKQAKELKTTGKESDDAKAVHSAITQPIFNASYLNNPTPQYPQSAKDAGVQGKVMLLVEVSEDGFAKIVQVSNSSGYSTLDNSAKNAVSKWKLFRRTESVSRKKFISYNILLFNFHRFY